MIFNKISLPQTGQLVGKRQVGGINLFSNKSGFEKIFLISVLTIFIGLFLPWVDVMDRNVRGFQNFYGLIVLALLVFSLSIFYFPRIKSKHISIYLVVIGIVSFLLVLRSFTELGYVIDPLTRIFIGYGIGLYITGLGSIGIFIAGIVGLKRKR